MIRTLWMAGCTLALLGVAAGAFGAHGLRGRVTPDLVVVWETAARYQTYHALALLAAALGAARWPGPGWGVAGALFVAGVVVFSGSLYLMVATGVRGLGAVTPIGGACFLAGWAALAWAGRAAVG
jgi:uncharacterized membrane protein YgdD (TMEM256/DUF423 family)